MTSRPPPPLPPGAAHDDPETAPPRSPPATPPHALARLTIDLAGLRANYVALRSIVGDAECAGVVKADAYGLGIEPVVRTLLGAQCSTFFVATLDEAFRARKVSADATIYVLGGLAPGSAPGYDELHVRPVLASLTEAEEWARYVTSKGRRLPVGLQIDTGMSRLGLPPADVNVLAARTDLLAALDVSLLISHLACADEPGHDMSRAQRQAFDELRARLPKTRTSLANSAGTFLGSAYHYDLVRPGIALYGGAPLTGVANPMKHVVTLEARILQVRELPAGASIGYGATYVTSRPTRLATLGLGYADGYMRALSSRGSDPGPNVFIAGHPAPLLGRVSMDLITADVTDVPEGVIARGAWAEVIGENVPLDAVAERAGTIGYEILTRLSRRAFRIYLEA